SDFLRILQDTLPRCLAYVAFPFQSICHCRLRNTYSACNIINSCHAVFSIASISLGGACFYSMMFIGKRQGQSIHEIRAKCSFQKRDCKGRGPLPGCGVSFKTLLTNSTENRTRIKPRS